MDDTEQNTSTADNPDALTQAVAERNAGAAPTGAVEQALMGFGSRLEAILSRIKPLESLAVHVAESLNPSLADAHTKIEAVTHRVETIADGFGGMVASVVPQAAPWFAAFEKLEMMFNEVVASLHDHFSGKIALPAPTNGALAASLKAPDAAGEAASVQT